MDIDFQNFGDRFQAFYWLTEAQNFFGKQPNEWSHSKKIWGNFNYMKKIVSRSKYASLTVLFLTSNPRILPNIRSNKEQMKLNWRNFEKTKTNRNTRTNAQNFYVEFKHANLKFFFLKNVFFRIVSSLSNTTVRTSLLFRDHPWPSVTKIWQFWKEGTLLVT